MHDESSVVHTLLRCGDEISEERFARPGCIDVGVWMENRGQVLPLTGVSFSGIILTFHSNLFRE